ncbi:MAG: hypothetical protein KGL39_00275 [Patescibacteria group bacterium]|nr:hypothetical protein [Patescibacteria group bacterium]
MFCEMLRNSIDLLNDDSTYFLDQEGGYGISTHVQDNEYPLVVIDEEKQEVRQEHEKDRHVLQRWSFEDFIKAEFADEE